MARQDNPFALLGDDDDGDDVAALLAKVEAKISPSVPAAEQPQPIPKGGASVSSSAGFPSKSPPPSEYVRGERGRGRGGRGRGPGRGGFGSNDGGNGSFGDDSAAQFGNRYPRDFGGDSDGRGRGRGGGGGGRGGRGRGRGRSYYDDRSNENQFDAGKESHGQDGEWPEARTEVQGRSYELGENRGSSYEAGKFGDENKGPGWEEKGYGGENRWLRGGEGREGRGFGPGHENKGSGWEEKGYGGENRRLRGGEGREGRGFGPGHENKGPGWEEKGYDGENRWLRGGEGREGRGFGPGRGARGGNFRRYSGRDGAGDGRSVGWNGSQEKEVAAEVKDQASNSAPTDVVPTGWDVPETTDAPKVADTEQVDAKQVVAEDVPEEKAPEDENKEMTLDEYEKVLQEKRKGLESLKTEERKVVLDKDFQSMQLIDKKKENDHFVKLKFDKDKLKKKDSFEKEEKVRKSVSINEFLKPVEGERYAGPAARGRGGGRGRGRGERGVFSGRRDYIAPAPHIEDPGQFPVLGAAAEA